MQTTTKQVARILDSCLKQCHFEYRLRALGDLLNALLCPEDALQLTDHEVLLAHELRCELIVLCPQAVAVAQGDEPLTTVEFDPVYLGM